MEQLHQMIGSSENAINFSNYTELKFQWSGELGE